MKKHYKISLYKALDNDLYSIYSLMKHVYDDLEDKSLFVCDDIDFVKQQLTKTGFGVIAKANDNIIGCLIVRFPGLEKDNLGYDIDINANELPKVAHIEAVVVDKNFRGNGLQQKMIEYAEQSLGSNKYYHLMATVSPENHASLKSFFNCNYTEILTKEKYGGLKRIILYKSVKGH